jgi:hypothetical protein
MCDAYIQTRRKSVAHETPKKCVWRKQIRRCNINQCDAKIDCETLEQPDVFIDCDVKIVCMTQTNIDVGYKIIEYDAKNSSALVLAWRMNTKMDNVTPK